MDTLITMTGWVGTPVEFKLTKNDVSHATFRLASTPRYRRGEEWTDGTTTWLTVTAYRALAEHLDDSVTKGEPVIAIGKLRTQTWVDSDGVVKERMVLEAQSVGHDLSLGTASFRKAKKHRATAEASYQASEPGASGSERSPGDDGAEGGDARGADSEDPDSGADGPEDAADYPARQGEGVAAQAA